jgi:phage terminase small subunit
MQLSNKQIRFVDECLVDLNGAQAAIRAGFSKRSARQIATRLLSKADIQKLIQKKQKETEKWLQITRDAVIQGLLRAAREARGAGGIRWRKLVSGVR